MEMTKKTHVTVTLDCNYRVRAKIKCVKSSNGTMIVIASAHLPKMKNFTKRICNESKVFINPFLVDDLEYVNEVKGKAFCSPEDTFDEEIGIKLASERLKKRLDEMVVSRLKVLYKELEKSINSNVFDIIK